jgi:hypothetical protein
MASQQKSAGKFVIMSDIQLKKKGSPGLDEVLAGNGNTHTYT